MEGRIKEIDFVVSAQNNYELLFKSLSQCTDDIIFVVDFEADEIIWSEQIKKITDISNVRKISQAQNLLAENNTP